MFDVFFQTEILAKIIDTRLKKALKPLKKYQESKGRESLQASLLITLIKIKSKDTNKLSACWSIYPLIKIYDNVSLHDPI